MLHKWSKPYEQSTVPTREGDTFVIAAGSKQSPAIVLLHGGMATSAMRLKDIGVWAKDFRVFAIDIIGDAGFSAPSRPSLRSEAHAAWLTDVFEALDISKSYLVGASLGGWIALDFAVRRPNAVVGMFLPTS
jgi:pimeloyl-ACP methyl ester carboxylesterase